MRKLLFAILLMSFLVGTLNAAWAVISLDELVADSQLIVIGMLHESSENYEGIGKGYILVDQVVTKQAITLENVPLKIGDNLKITWTDNWACASGMHRGREGRRGLWLLEVQSDGTVTAGYPGRFLPVEEIDEVERLLRRTKVGGSVRVDATAELPSHPATDSPITIDHYPVVDVTPFNEGSPSRAVAAFLISFGLYCALYRSRFRIR